MTARIRAVVRSTRTKIAGWAWCAAATDDETGETLKFEADYAPSMKTALAAAYAALERLDKWLMNEVHQSRASRRQAFRDIDATRTEEAHVARLAWQEYNRRPEPEIHTMEPTA